MIARPSAIINRLANDRASVVGYHRFLNNVNVCYQAIMEGHYESLAHKAYGKETGHAIENLIALVFIAAIRVFQMVKSRNDQHRSALDIFDKQEIALLTKVNKGIEGKSQKSKNANKRGSLAFIIWIVARLGDWKPEDKDPPGPITILKGWIVLQNYLKINQILSG